RETFSARGTPAISENYIDSGHPYWAMLGFIGLLSIPNDDPFYAEEEGQLPVEKADFLTRFDGPRMMLLGTQRTGQVKWLQARPATRRDYYRDKYMKFVNSAHFPFNIGPEKGRLACDQLLAFRDPRTGEMVARTKVDDGGLLEDGLR